MDFSTTEDQDALRELARQILESEASHERLKEVEAGDERIDRALWQALAKANLVGVPFDEAYGGLGLGLEELCIVLEEIGRAVAPVPARETMVHAGLAIAEFGSNEQRQKLLPGVVAGDTLLTAALVETADTGVTATADGDGFTLSGTLAMVPHAHVADRMLVPASTGAGIGLFLVSPSAGGVAVETAEVVDQSLHATVRLDGTRVGGDDQLGQPDQGDAMLAWIRERALLAQCAVQVGVASRALEMAASYTTERRQFDRPVGSFQAVHTRAGDAFVDLQCMRLAYWRALHVVAHGEPSADALAVAKYWCGEAGARITYAAQHLHGGTGVDTDYPLHRYYLWATHGTMSLGGPQAQLAALGERIAAR